MKATNPFRKTLEDQRAVMAAIRAGKSLKALEQTKNIRFVQPAFDIILKTRSLAAMQGFLKSSGE